MEFTVKLADYADIEAAVAVEEETMGGTGYLRDAWHYFNSLGGGLVCVYDGDKMIGIGRFSVLPDGSGWLETLRVIPSYQRKGAGRKIYDKYVELAKANGCPSMAMFTGLTNVASSSLAEIYGLRTLAQHKGWNLTDLSGGDAHGFKHVNWKRAEELIVPMKEKYHDYMTFNRTFHHINSANAKQFACEGKVFEDKDSGSFIVCGARFQHQVTLHIAMMGGDYDKCIDFAINYAKAQGLEKITCTVVLENEEVQNALAKRGFVMDKGTIITKEVKF